MLIVDSLLELSATDWAVPLFSAAFLLEVLVGGGVCIEAADFAESTVPGPSSP